MTSLLIDNDLPCAWCARFPQGALPPEQGCASCDHRAGQPEQLFCALSRAGLPPARSCCHWNAPQETRPLLHLGPGDVAPGVLDWWGAPSVDALFQRSETAPGYVERQGGHIQVALDDLALPLVYGVPASQWDDALGGPAEQPVSGADTAPAPQVPAALLGLLDALDGAGDQWAARGHAAHLQAQQRLDELPAPWQALVIQALRLYGELASALPEGAL